ncbi:MAG TPA: Fe(3+) ABC transporter substrate-binding protein [Peptococcaceae bacterium]|nr:MAG: Iron ABC transporter substrate-binding protein [Moorella sp. 60_41]HBT47069.1 Fe(3+) ABC transporter substrate-binding protein [Peptococcaceae bacterium]
MRLSKLVAVLMLMAIVTGLAGCGTDPKPRANPEKVSEEKIVNVYTARHYDVDKKLFAKFTEETGIRVNVLEGKAEELIERIKREGSDTAADVFITVDGGILAAAKEQGILQPVWSSIINQNVPSHLRDRDNHWIGIATRARVIVYAKDRVNPQEITTYEDLADPKWKGKVLVRSSTSLYNVSLLASFIALHGEEKAEAWARGIVNNFARPPQGNDRDQARAIAAGIGDVAIMNTYYLGLMANSKEPEEAKVAQKIGVIFPDQATTGTHINISGIGLTRHSKHTENAIRLIEFLTGKEAQELIAAENFEFPVNPTAGKPELLRSWGEFKAQELNFDLLAQYNRKALEIFSKVGWK